LKALESHRNQKRRTLFDAQDEVDRQREELKLFCALAFDGYLDDDEFAKNSKFDLQHQTT
jgi:hypothetical protein